MNKHLCWKADYLSKVLKTERVSSETYVLFLLDKISYYFP